MCIIDIFHTHSALHERFVYVHKDIQKVSTQDSLIVSHDVCCFFSNIPLSETIDIAVTLMFENIKYVRFLENELTKLYCFATSQTQFYLNEKLSIRLME